MRQIPTPSALAIALSAVLLASPAYADPAKNPGPDEVALKAQLESARADLQRSARRFADLSRQLGENADRPAVIQQRVMHRPMLGVLLAPDPLAGVRITGVTPDSPASKAGLRGGDRLIAIDGHQILGSSGELRVANARELLDRLDAKTPVKLGLQRGTQTLALEATPSVRDATPSFVFVAPNGDIIEGSGDTLIQSDAHGISARNLAIDPPGVSPQIQREVIRMGPGGDLPLLADAFRWNGLNLAAVDSRLGRYFGTSSGVLVLSTGDSLAGLQPGDVLRRIDGKAVASPREAMAALRAHAAGTRVPVEYLRDHRTATTQVTVPKAMSWPPPPPAAPRAPAAPRPPSPPPAPAAPPAAVLDELPALPTMSSLALLAPPAPASVVILESRDAVETNEL